MLYLFITKASSGVVKAITGHNKQTVAGYRRFFMQLLANSLDDEDVRIGGPGIRVEVDESKLGKRKNHRGHKVDGVWILVGVEKTQSRKIFIETIVDRTSESLLEVISRLVLPGSIVRTDFWKGYIGLREAGYEHERVNHSRYFTDPETGVNTNTVEGTNNGIKQSVQPRNRTKASVEGYLSTFVWRRKHLHNQWEGLLEALKLTAYVE